MLKLGKIYKILENNLCFVLISESKKNLKVQYFKWKNQKSKKKNLINISLQNMHGIVMPRTS